MKIIARKLNKGLIVLQTEMLDDLWVLYNLISIGDYIEGKTSRRVVHKNSDDSKGERKLIFLKVLIEDIEFHEFSNRLRLKGKIVEGPEDLVTLNTYHTFNIDENTKFGITKEKWTQFHFKILDEAAKQRIIQKLLVVAIDIGEATFGEIGDYYQKTSISLSEHIPGKRYGDVKDNKNAKNAFFSDVLKNIQESLKAVDYTKIVIAGPGFIREEFLNYCVKKEPSLSSKLITEAVSSATKSGIYELFKKQTIQSLMKDSRILEESNLVEEFLARLGQESGTVAYGMDEIKNAAEMGAIEDLLITDEVMRTINAEKNVEMLELLKLIEKNRGNVKIISTLHDAGRRVKGFGGMVALLRFKLSYE
ncbi:MAG: mRNA surveillance protein pelota [Candidatus Hodarchaeota archaeon]